MIKIASMMTANRPKMIPIKKEPSFEAFTSGDSLKVSSGSVAENRCTTNKK